MAANFNKNNRQRQKNRKLWRPIEEVEESEELTVEEILSVAGAAEKIADPMQQLNMMEQIAAVGKLELYYNVAIEGGIYKDNLILEGGTIEDNVKGLRNFTQDNVHKSIVRSQYRRLNKRR